MKGSVEIFKTILPLEEFEAKGKRSFWVGAMDGICG